MIPMSAPIAYRKPKSGRLVLLFVLSIGAHVGLAMFAIWAGNHLRPLQKPEEMLDLGMDVTLGEEVQELVVAETPPAKGLRRAGTMKGSVLCMGPDFNAPLEEFKEYME